MLVQYPNGEEVVKQTIRICSTGVTYQVYQNPQSEIDQAKEIKRNKVRIKKLRRRKVKAKLAHIIAMPQQVIGWLKVSQDLNRDLRTNLISIEILNQYIKCQL